MLDHQTPDERALRRRNWITLGILVAVVLFMAATPHLFREDMMPHFYKY